MPCTTLACRSKGKNKEKVNNAILFSKESFDKMLAEVPKYKMITISILADRLRVNCSLARRAIAALVARPRNPPPGPRQDSRTRAHAPGKPMPTTTAANR